MGGRPLVVIEGDAGWAATEAALAAEQARQAGWQVAAGSAGAARSGIVWQCRIGDAEDARRALLRVVDGAGLIAIAECERETTDQLLDDLRRLGDVEHLTTDDPAAGRLGNQQLALLALLGEGLTLGQAAHLLGLARRTADRRLAEARQLLGVPTTAEAVIAASRRQRTNL